MALLGRISKFLDSNSSIPKDVKFLFQDEAGSIKEVKAHKFVLAVASEVFERQFYGYMKSEDEIDIKDATQEVFKEMIEYIYNKKINLTEYNLDFLSSFYYLADKYEIEVLKDEIIASVPNHKVSDENILEVAILAEANILHVPFSDALYDAATSFLKNKFDGKVENVFDFFAETEASEIHGLVLLKMVARMKVLVLQGCENCRKASCLNGQKLTLENFVPGAMVTHRNKGDGSSVKLIQVEEAGSFSCIYVGKTYHGQDIKYFSY
eukprot:GFUD01029836.1.p1 GENE.GFUD01029836.1~~GFUD01029836.1.p1  ORF type:complete len:266 (+),score=70.19 GFUD01029836.1:59-856(+)